MPTPEDLGVAYERTLDPATRRRFGAFYTPAPLAEDLARHALIDADRDARVCDPAVGGGALLLAAARILLERGADPKRLAHHQLVGRDIDPAAVEVARAALAQLLGHRPQKIEHGDSLDADQNERFDVVITNPPFLNQLHTTTARSRADARAAAERWGPAAQGYADSCALFLLLSRSLVREGGRVGIILPEPVLAARDAAATRRRIGEQTTIEWMSRPGLGAFDAGVRVVLCTLRAEPAGDGPWRRGDWAIVAPSEAPACVLATSGVVGDIATVTADFRDQYYGVVGAVTDDRGGVPLVTTGLIDPARVWWGRRAATIAGQRLARPTVNVGILSPKLQQWATRRLVPKVMIATQTRVIEAAADEAGTYLPGVPLITAVPASERLWHLLAALLGPPVAAHAHRAHTGAALSADAIKLSARQVAALPLPADRRRWDEGAMAAREATVATNGGPWRQALDQLGAIMCEAYGTDPAVVMPWWSVRVDRVAARAPQASGAESEQ